MKGVKMYTVLIEAPDGTMSHYSESIENIIGFKQVVGGFLKDNYQIDGIDFEVEDHEGVCKIYHEIISEGIFTFYMVPQSGSKYVMDSYDNHKWI